jgi:glycosyltransferase involved in cell wall biosynthesis
MPTLFYDTTKSRKQGHISGLKRVSAKLRESLELQDAISLREVHWSLLKRSYVDASTGKSVGTGKPGDVFFTPEVFALRERPFCRGWLNRFAGKKATLFYDAIPYFHPEITWPHSVRRFPRWFGDLQAYDHVFFISSHAREEARTVYQETGFPAVDGDILPLGCDYGQRGDEAAGSPSMPVLLNVGILEPRKGQDCLLSVCDRLWMQGLEFKLVFLGRVNPHYGRPLLDRIDLLQQSGRDVIHEDQVDDERLAGWHAKASLAVLPSRAEGFGLPVLEALWAGCPVLCSDQPSLDMIPEHKGIEVLDEVSEEALEKALGALLETPADLASLRKSIDADALPRWESTAGQLAQALGLLPSS